MANNKNLTDAEKKALAEKKAAEKAEKERLKAEEAEAKKAEAENSEIKHKVKSEKDCGFKSRNYYINGRNVLLVAGEGIEEEDYNCFSQAAKEKYFTTS